MSTYQMMFTEQKKWQTSKCKKKNNNNQTKKIGQNCEKLELVYAIANVLMPHENYIIIDL